MTDTAPAPEPEAPEAPEAPVVDETEKWKALARKHETNAKANAAAAKRLAEIEEQGKSETQRLTDATTAAEQRAADAELRALRLEVGADKGLTPKQARRLVGTTREELETDADELLTDFGPSDTDGQGATPRTPSKPRENLRSGGDPTTQPLDSDPLLAALKAKLGAE